jgi:DNA-directed RNA polymerase subunit alpha
MAILDFQKPDKVVMNHSNETSGQFEFRPLEPGYGITIGNALRRVLLNSLEGHAITNIRIAGIDHEFSTIRGVVEDVTEFILNLKQVRFKKQIEQQDSEKVSVTIHGKTQFTAGDIAKHTSAFQVLNPEHVICHMESDVKLQIEVTIDKGRGYRPSEENKTE